MDRTKTLKIGLSVALLAACASVSHAHAAAILYTNDVMGELEPCGCRANPLGGMIRKQGLAEKLRADGEKDLLQLDAGDLLFDQSELPAALEKQAKLQARLLLRAHAAIGPLISTPGEKDFALGVNELLRIAASGKPTSFFVSANLRREGRLLLPAHRIQIVGEGKSRLRIGVIGVTGTQLGLPKGLTTADPIEAVKREIRALHGKTDLLIALSHQGIAEDRKLAAAAPDLDWIIGGHTQSFLQEPVTVGETRIVQSSFRNQYVGIIRLPTGAHTLQGLETSYEEQPAQATRKLVEELKTAIAKTNRETTAPPTPNQSGRIATFATCLQCHEKQFDFWRKTSHANALVPLAAQKQLMNLECIRCHSVGFDRPGGFKTLSQVASLKRKTPEGERTEALALTDLEPFLNELHRAPHLDAPVHLRRADPPLPAREALARIGTSFAPVQCENCHGPANGHPFASSTPTLQKKVLRETCVQCHNAERAPAWYRGGKLDETAFAAKLKSVSCPAGDSP